MSITGWLVLAGAVAFAGLGGWIALLRRRVESLSEALQSESRQRRTLEHEVKAIVRTDPATGLLNRQAFVAELRRQLHRAAQQHLPLTIAILDIDHFRNVNETYGQASGDHVLQEFSGICRDAVRARDLVCCLGGEEFGIILPETAARDACPVAERICRTLGSRVIRLPQSGDFSVTVSCGVAVCEPGETLDELMSRADRAMCAAKKRGRSRVVLAEPREQLPLIRHHSL
jgi:diguanylate cyclase (GGDEF)-like protein